MRAEGVRRKLVGVEIGDKPMPEEMEEFWPVHASEREVGYVTNSVWSPRLEKNIGYAWVPIELASPGTALTRPSSSPADSSASADVET